MLTEFSVSIYFFGDTPGTPQKKIRLFSPTRPGEHRGKEWGEADGFVTAAHRALPVTASASPKMTLACGTAPKTLQAEEKPRAKKGM